MSLSSCLIGLLDPDPAGLIINVSAAIQVNRRHTWVVITVISTFIKEKDFDCSIRAVAVGRSKLALLKFQLVPNGIVVMAS